MFCGIALKLEYEYAIIDLLKPPQKSIKNPLDSLMYDYL